MMSTCTFVFMNNSKNVFSFVSGRQTEAAGDHMIADKIDGVSWESISAGKEFIKFSVSTTSNRCHSLL